MIPLMKVHTPPNIGQVMQEVWDSGFVTEGEYADRFEKSFGEWIGNPNVALVNSCTSALWLAAHMSGVGPDTEVITTAMTCMATNVPFANMGAKLVFADIDPTTGNIDPSDIEHRITDKTKAIVVVHWAGMPCDMNEIMEIAHRHDVRVIEDAAHALGSVYGGRLIGNHGDFVCFSFQAVKHMTTADGGALVMQNEEDAKRARKLRWFGLDRHHKAPPGEPPQSRWEQDITEAGYKLHMNNVNAAIGLEQLKYIDVLIHKHIMNGRYYDEHIINPKVELLRRPDDRLSTTWIYSLLVDDRERFKSYLEEMGIASDRVHVRNDVYSCFKEFHDPSLVNLTDFDNRLINIPVGWWVDRNERKYIVDVVNSY